ncbi:DUF4209 domain-containing protein [Janthinobacterium sp. PSPC3-1]|uniref:DUF4209 domain-containing protein n=1 Tax=Janthinobacterium sp. PSPC3-1 TaxID=2804653 RepID=UPI003CE9EA3F
MTDSSATPAPLPFTFAEFVAAEVSKILGAHAEADCHALNKVFWKAKEGAKSAAASRALELLAGICSMRLVPEEPAHIYRPMFEFSDGGSSMTLGHIPKDAIDALAQLTGTLDSAPLRARLADLVWLLDRSRGHAFPLMAIQAYRRLLLSSDAWRGESKAGWHRAMQLAKQIHAEDEARAIETALLDAFFAAAGDEDGYQALHYLHALRVERRSGGRAQAVAERLEAIGRQRMALTHAFEAQSHFEAAAEWYEWARDRDRQALMLCLAAEAITMQAGQADGAIVEHHWLSKAIEAYRRVPARFRAQLGTEGAIEALRRRREDAGHAMLGEMVVIRGPRDVGGRIQAAVDHVKGRPALEALLAFCGLDSPPDVGALKAAAEAALKATPLSTMMGMHVVAGDGRQVEHIGPDNGWQAQVDARARAMFLEHANKVALAELLPARDQLRFEHDFRLGDFIAIAERSPVVPSDRVRILGQGLYAGYCGDMVQAMHILMPQFEHVVRQVLQGAGAFTAQHDKGLDMEVALGRLVERPQLAEEFGDGLTLVIHAVMCDRAGPNLRNDVAHGLADEEACESALALYAWWLILQLVSETCAAAMDAATPPDQPFV